MSTPTKIAIVPEAIALDGAPTSAFEAPFPVEPEDRWLLWSTATALAIGDDPALRDHGVEMVRYLVESCEHVYVRRPATRVAPSQRACVWCRRLDPAEHAA